MLWHACMIAMSRQPCFLRHSVVNCTTLGAPDNGTISGDSVSFQSEVTYSCDVGFILSGDTSRMCQADGNWTGSAPVCNSTWLHLYLQQNGAHISINQSNYVLYSALDGWLINTKYALQQNVYKLKVNAGWDWAFCMNIPMDHLPLHHFGGGKWALNGENTWKHMLSCNLATWKHENMMFPCKYSI